MGKVPVAPSSSRVLFEGERKANGFIDRRMLVKLRRIEIAKRKQFTMMIVLIMWDGERCPWTNAIFFHQEPGLDRPQ